VTEDHGATEVTRAAIATEDASALRVAGQRHINARWEGTQAVCAVAVTLVTLGVCAFQVIAGKGGEGAFMLLGNAFFLVIGTYFQRTNHQKVGGVGVRDEGR
jgi:hypothetical protein